MSNEKWVLKIWEYIPDCGHWTQVEKAETVNRWMLEFTGGGFGSKEIELKGGKTGEVENKTDRSPGLQIPLREFIDNMIKEAEEIMERLAGDWELGRA